MGRFCRKCLDELRHNYALIYSKDRLSRRAVSAHWEVALLADDEATFLPFPSHFTLIIFQLTSPPGIRSSLHSSNQFQLFS